MPETQPLPDSFFLNQGLKTSMPDLNQAVWDSVRPIIKPQYEYLQAIFQFLTKKKLEATQTSNHAEANNWNEVLLTFLEKSGYSMYDFREIVSMKNWTELFVLYRGQNKRALEILNTKQLISNLAKSVDSVFKQRLAQTGTPLHEVAKTMEDEVSAIIDRVNAKKQSEQKSQEQILAEFNQMVQQWRTHYELSTRGNA